MERMIYSATCGGMIVKGFTRIKRRGDKMISKFHYTWSESDALYWNDEVDDDYYMDKPDDGVRTFEDWKGEYTLEIISDKEEA